jgi:hypothetical protein
MWTTITALLSLITACLGCDGGGSAAPDAALDAAVDAAPDAAGNGQCGADLFVTGELVDLDSTNAQLMGVFNARLAVSGMPARSSTTAPNGRFELCAPAAAAITLDVDAPGAYLDGPAYLEAQALAGRPLSFRTFTAARAASLYTYDPARGHVLVYLAGDRSDLTLSRAHGPALVGNDDDNDGAYDWSPGTAGRYVLFPNVDVSAPTITLGGDISGPHQIPVAAGKLTLVAIFFVYL